MIEINCTGSDTIELHQLTEFQGELKERSAGDIEKIIKSIRKHGFSFPFFVWKNDGKNNVIDGHGRLKALQQMAAAGEEIPALPCVYISAKDEAEAKEKLLKLNSQYGHMTADSVADFLDGMEIELDDLALPDGVLDLSSIETPEEETEGDDDAPDVDEDGEPDSQPGEMYELGNSILLCGDSTNPDDVARLMGGEKADMVFTDPPYGVDYKGINNDSRGGLEELLDKAFENMRNNSKKGVSFYCFHSDKCADIFHKVYRKYCHFSSMIIWKKQSLVLSQTDFQSIHEPCLYGWFDNGEHRFYADRKQTSVWEYDRKTIEGHTTPKPVDLIMHALDCSSKSEDIVLDVFGGSGSTLIAAEKLGRRARIMELGPKYCDVIRKRWTKWAKENGREVGSGGLE